MVPTHGIVVCFASLLAPQADSLPEIGPLSGVVTTPPVGFPENPPSGPAAAGPNVRLNQDLGLAAQNEPVVALHPTDSFRLVAAWNDYRLGDSRIGYGWTTNGGVSWSDGLAIEPTYQVQGDPSADVDLAGRFFLAMLSFNRDPVTGGASAGVGSGIFVARSTSGGASFATPVRVGFDAPNAFEDKPYVAVDRTVGGYAGSVYVVWTRFLNLDTNPHTFEASEIRFAFSRDGGPSYVSAATISDFGTNGHAAFPVVAPDGTVVVVWRRGTTFFLDRSTDGGVTFGFDFPIFGISPLPATLNGGFKANSWPALAVQGGSGPGAGRLYLAWADYATGDADVLVRRSLNGGFAWDPPVRVNDDAVGNGKDQFFPAIAVGPDGVVHVAWLDRRDDPANLLFRCAYANSTDGGGTFSPNLAVSSALSSPSTNFGGTFIGDYNGIVADGPNAYPVWVDSRLGSQDAFTTGVHAGTTDLAARPSSVAVASGGTVGFVLSPGPSHANRNYLLLGSASGTSPGVSIGGVVLPLNPDSFTNALAVTLNSGTFHNFLSTTNAFGIAQARLTVAPGAAFSLVGQTLSFAYLLFPPIDYASEPVSVTIVP